MGRGQQSLGSENGKVESAIANMTAVPAFMRSGPSR